MNDDREQGVPANPAEAPGEDEQRRLLREFNDTRRDFPSHKSFHELFEEQAARTPGDEAVVSPDGRITYGEINAKANQLARRLAARGVGPDRIVGLLVDDNSIEMIIGMLGILKAGGAFLSLDADLPRERIDHMIAESDMTVLLTQSSSAGEIHFPGTAVDLGDPAVFAGDGSNLGPRTRPGNLAYVFYTSGSTGKPKGVLIEHASIVNQMSGLIERYDFTRSLAHILLASITFDPSVQQIFLPLISGGRLFLVAKETKTNPKDLWEFIVANRIDIVNTVPSLISVLLDQADRGAAPHFKFIILAGEVFSKGLYLRLKETISADKVINIYGPTEATINTTLYECEDEEAHSTIPIGRPLANYQVLILDDRQRLLPIGSPGEICISGVGLARGYLKSPELTREKFLPHPFEPGARIYRTGDVGRWTPEGNLEFVGRVDDQVKIGGIRIELGEIESALGQHPAVKQVVVAKWVDQAGIPRLIAYVLPNHHQVSAEDLRRFLKDKLPDYMVPAAFMTIDRIPLTPHGKVDRRALPEPEIQRLDPGSRCLPPRNERESRLVEIWEKVLGVDPIGIADDFFDLGGTSLLAMILFGEVDKAFGKRLPLATIFEAPTIEKLAHLIAGEASTSSWSPLVAIQPKGSLPPLFCLHGHRGNVVGFFNLVESLGPDQPLYGVQARGLDGQPVGERKIEDMAADYVNEILSVQPQGPYFLAGWCMGGIMAYEMAQILRRQGHGVGLVAIIDAYPPLAPHYLPSSNRLLRMIYTLIEKTDHETSNLRALDAEARLPYVLAKTRNIAGIARAVVERTVRQTLDVLGIDHAPSFAYMLDVLKEAHQRAIDVYVPRPYPGRVAIFRASKQPLGIHPDPALNWGDLITGELELQEVPGHYLNLFVEPSVHLLGEKLKASLEKARRRPANPSV